MMLKRVSNRFLVFLSLCLVLFLLMLLHSVFLQKSNEPAFALKRKLVGRLGLADLCLFTDARYTRHPTAADLNTPFQDYPLSLEHFPSGSLLPIPPHLRPGANE